MKERPIDFSIQDKPAIVEDPTGELLSELKKQYKDIQSNLGMCITMLEKGQLTEGMKENFLSLTDYNVYEFLTKMGYEGVLAEEQKKRHSEIRSLYDENRQLRQQLGEKVSNEDVRERLKIMQKSFEAWWSEYGFGHCSEFYINGYHAKAILSGMVFNSRPIKKKWHQKEYLSTLGFEIEEQLVVYNDKSIELLKKMLTDKYPNIFVSDIKLTASAQKGITVIQEIAVYIYNLDDLLESEPATE